MGCAFDVLGSLAEGRVGLALRLRCVGAESAARPGAVSSLNCFLRRASNIAVAFGIGRRPGLVLWERSGSSGREGGVCACFCFWRSASNSAEAFDDGRAMGLAAFANSGEEVVKSDSNDDRSSVFVANVALMLCSWWE